LVADLKEAISWAEQNKRRWAFTSSNAGSRYFEDFCDLSQLNEIDWDAVRTDSWQSCSEKKQAEFLIENCFPWELVERIGVISKEYKNIVNQQLTAAKHKPEVEVQSHWYY